MGETRDTPRKPQCLEHYTAIYQCPDKKKESGHSGEDEEPWSEWGGEGLV